MIQSLTPFGLELAEAVRNRSINFDSSIQTRGDAYEKNVIRVGQLRDAISKNPRILIAGAGKIDDISDLNGVAQNLLRCGVNWTNFNPDLDIQVLCSTHAIAIEAALFANTLPEIMIHGVYSKVPPCISRSFTMRWSDPLMNKDYGGQPTPQKLEKTMSKTCLGAAPYIPSVRNVVFLNAMVMIWLGAKKLYFTGIDPLTPDYFFAGKPNLALNLVTAITQTNPWIAEWDGRNERIADWHRETEHRRMKTVANLLSTKGSAVGSKARIEVMNKGFKILLDYANFKNVKVAYIGKSKYFQSIGLSRVA